VGHVAPVGEIRNAFKRPLGRPRRIWKDKMRTDVRKTGWGGVD